MSAERVLDLTHAALMCAMLAWLFVDARKRRRRDREERALFERVKQQGGEWTDADNAELKRLYPDMGKR